MENLLVKALHALEPFANKIYNDNGDMTVNTDRPDAEDLIRAYQVHKQIEDFIESV